MIYLLCLLPIITIIILYLIFKDINIFKIGGIFLVITLIYSLSHQAIMENGLTSATEWWGNYATSIHYYDDWDEEVSCRHPIYCTRTYECGDGKTSRTCTETYVCGHEHLYDVDYHSEYWTIKYDNNNEQNITHLQYIYWSALWGNHLYKIDLHRDYHSNDGDDIACDWDLKPETSETIITEHFYVNKIQASNSVFKADKVDSTDIRQYKLFNYPNDGKKIVLGAVLVDKPTQKLYDYINGYYGSKKQFKLFICVFRNQSEIAAERQHSYWKNLNKNELLVCIGVDNINKVKWCKSYSWMDKPILSVKVEQWFRDNKNLNLNAFARWLPKNIEDSWSRKHFRDFNYIKIEITQSQYMIIFIIVFILCIIQVIVTIKLITNE